MSTLATRRRSSNVKTVTSPEIESPNSITGRPGSPGRPGSALPAVSPTIPSVPPMVSPSVSSPMYPPFTPPNEVSTVTLPNTTPVSIMTTPRAIHIGSLEQGQLSTNELTGSQSIDLTGLQNVDAELIKYGYIPINKILLDEKTPSQRIKYIKAYNPYGELVYILLDGEGVCQGNLCTTMNEISSAESIPYALKMTATECNNLDICGVLFECEKSILTLHRRKDNPAEFDEQLFIHERLLGTPGRNYFRDGSVSMPYPIVKLSELRINPEAVLISSDESFRRMRNEFYKLADTELVGTNKLYNQLDLQAKRFQNNAASFSTKLLNDINQLETLASEHKALGTLNDIQKANYKLVLSNLRKRHEFLEEYLRHVDHYNQAQNVLNSMIEDLNQLNIHIEATINNLGKVLPE